jgi:hypothetical protein
MMTWGAWRVASGPGAGTHRILGEVPEPVRGKGFCCEAVERLQLQASQRISHAGVLCKAVAERARWR